MLTVRRTPRARVRVPAFLGSLESMAALALAHGAAGGAGFEPLWLLAFGAGVYAASGFVLRGRATIRLVLPLLLAAQVLGHAWLVTLTSSGHGGHLPDAAPFLGLTPSMLAAHLLAAAVTGVMWVLRRRAVEVLLHWSEPGTLPAVERVRSLAATTVRPLLSRRHVTARAPRGPPLPAAATA